MPKILRNLAKKMLLKLIYILPPSPQRLHGNIVWVHPRARFSISTSTFFRGETHVRKWMNEHLKQGNVFFDLGAHHGWVSMWALLLVGKEGAVYSFEPSPVNLMILEWHKKVNKFSQWTIVPKAASDIDVVEMNFSLIDSGDSPMNSLTSGAPGTQLMEGRDISNIQVQTTTLDTFCKEIGVRPNLVKIDVEGAELLVLQGAMKLLGESNPTVILSVHPYWLPSGQSTQQIVEFIKGFDYSIFDSTGVQVNSLRKGEYLLVNRNSPLPN